ncbi:MAG: choice-of-anchor Q domain-containing protein [Bacteroidia bacterium]
MKKRLAFLILFAMMGSMAWSQTVIYVNAAAGGANNGTSWADAYKDFQVALNSAAAGSQIWVAAGTYKPKYDLSGAFTPNSRFNTFHFQTDVEVYGGFLGTETSLSQRVCNPANPTILSGDLGVIGDRNDNAIHVCYSEGLTVAFLIDCVTIRDAFGRFNNADISGGGWYNMAQGASSNPTLRQCKFLNNYGGRGGAFYNDGTNGGQANPEFVDCEFSSNSGAYGAAICNDGSMGGESSPTVTNCLFLQNVGGHGGAIYNDGIQGNANGVFTNCEFTQNTAKMGGALYIAADDGTSRAEFNQCIFSSNSVLESGGAVAATAVNGDAKTTFTDCAFEYNTCDKLGGAVWNHGASPWFVTCQFLRNSSSIDGGAMYNDGANFLIANPRLTSCILEENSATGNGGAIYNQAFQGDASPFVIWSKFIANSADNGGAIYNDCVGNAGSGQIQATFYNCLFSRNHSTNRGGVAYNIGNGGSTRPAFASCSFAGNVAGAGHLFYSTQSNGGTCSVRTYNMASYGQTGTISSMSGGAFIEAYGGMYEPALGAICYGSCYLGGNPMFTNAAADDLTLQPNSVAIDAGINSWVIPMFPLDLAGNPRIQGGVIDFGAYETPAGPPCPRVLYVNRIATGSNNGTSWANAYRDLQSALAQARINTCIDTILIAEGVYKPTSINDRYANYELVNGIEIYGGFPGTGNPWFPDRDLVLHETVLSGDIGIIGNNSDNSYSVVTGKGSLATAPGTFTLNAGTILHGVTVARGVTGLCLYANSNSFCALRVDSCKFYGSQRDIQVTVASSGMSGATNVNLSPVFRNCQMINHTGNMSSVVVETYTTGNITAPEFHQCTFANNVSTNAAGAMWLRGAVDVWADRCKFYNNTSTVNSPIAGGGAIFLESAMAPPNGPSVTLKAKVTNSIFHHNVATRGGAVYAWVSGQPVGVYSYLDADFINCTFANNTAQMGSTYFGYLSYGSSTVRLKNCITWGNGNAAQGAVAYLQNLNGTLNTLVFTNSLIESPACGTTSRLFSTIPGAITCGPGNIFNANPQFMNPGGNDYSLNLASPAINGGDNSLVPGYIIRDIAGNDRIDMPSGGIVDMGCYENFPGMALRTAAPGSSAESANAAEAVANVPQDILIYPNPVSDVLHLDLGGFEYEHGLLLDAMGKVVKEWTGSVTEIDMGSLAAGVYVLRLQGKDAAVAKRVVKD